MKKTPQTDSATKAPPKSITVQVKGDEWPRIKALCDAVTPAHNVAAMARDMMLTELARREKAASKRKAKVSA
jgi:hypothetical protein